MLHHLSSGPCCSLIAENSGRKTKTSENPGDPGAFGEGF
jgi:hypothetical protein